jgi:hypothetical protein
MNSSLKMNWVEIQEYLKTFHTYDKGLKEEGWRIPSMNEMSYIYDIFELGISGIKSGEYWTSNVYTTGNSGEPTSCLVFVFSPFRTSNNPLMKYVFRGTMSIKLPVILVRDI